MHRARITFEYKVKNNIPSITWPAQSPDINIIENIWLKIKRSLQSMTRDITTQDELFYVLLDIWQNIAPEYVKNLYLSIPSRIQAVVRSKGHLTKNWEK